MPGALLRRIRTPHASAGPVRADRRRPFRHLRGGFGTLRTNASALLWVSVRAEARARMRYDRCWGFGRRRTQRPTGSANPPWVGWMKTKGPVFGRQPRLRALDWLAWVGTLVLATCTVSCLIPLQFWESDLGHATHESGIGWGVLRLGIVAENIDHGAQSHNRVDWSPFAGFERFHNQVLRLYLTDHPQPHKDGWLAGLNLWPLGAVPVALWVFIRGRCWLVRRRWRATGCCIACGYNLTGNTSGQCPECGGHGAD